MTRLKALALLVPALLAPLPALALSCLPPDPVRAYQEAEASPESWAVLVGDVIFDATRMPPIGMVVMPGEVMPPQPRIPARFDGRHLEAGALVPSALRNLSVQRVCAGPYCGTMEPGEHLVFARATPQGYLVEVGPCGGSVFPVEAATAILGCIRGIAGCAAR